MLLTRVADLSTRLNVQGAACQERIWCKSAHLALGQHHLQQPAAAHPAGSRELPWAAGSAAAALQLSAKLPASDVAHAGVNSRCTH